MTLPGTMKALIQTEDGFSRDVVLGEVPEDLSRFLEIADIPVPKPKPGQVLIRVRGSMFNPSDLTFIQGGYGQPREKGKPAGFEGVGDVVDGNGLYARYLKGKRVSFVVGPGGSGAWAEYAVAEAATVIPLRKDVRDEDGAALIVNPLTAAAMVDMVPPGGAFIASAAASQLGKLMAGVAKESGKRMIALVRRDAPAETLKKLGAAHVLNETSEDFAESLKTVLAKEKPTVFLDAVSGSVSARVFLAMGKDSRWIVYGKLTPEPAEILAPGELIFLRKKIEGFWLMTWFTRTSFLGKMRAIKQVQARFADGRWKTDISSVVTLRNALTELPSALRKPDGKVMIRPK